MNRRKQMKVGWVFFGLMWIPFIIFIIGSMSHTPDPHTPHSINDLPGYIKYSLYAMGFCLALTFLFMASSFMRVLSLGFGAGGNAQIHKNGKPGKAKILRLYETGTTVNYQPVVGFELEVFPQNGAVFKAKTEQMIRRLDIPNIQPGMEVNIKYNKKNKKVVIV